MNDIAPLFAAIKIENKTFRNRIVLPPMVISRGIDTQEGRDWYARRARGGVALVIVEATDIVYFSETLSAGSLKPLADAIHREGALAAIQLFPGIRTHPVSPTDLSLRDIEKLMSLYHKASAACAEAGFDGIEPHGAHGYILNQFFSPEQNRRTDQYGGSIEGRMRLALEVIEAVKPAPSQAGMLLLYRHTPVGPGYGIEESLKLGESLVRAGVDILDISPASSDAPGDRAAPFMALGVPVIAVNELDRLPRALEVLQMGRASLVAVGRGMIADPDWPEKVRSGRLEEIIACTGCNDCYTDLREGRSVGCSQWMGGVSP